MADMAKKQHLWQSRIVECHNTAQCQQSSSVRKIRLPTPHIYIGQENSD